MQNKNLELLGKKPLFNASSSKLLEPLYNNKAFSLIGVLVASAVGLIVVTGITKLFVHMSSQNLQLEQQAKRANLVAQIGSFLNNPVNCKATLQSVPDLNVIKQPSTSSSTYPITFSQLKPGSPDSSDPSDPNKVTTLSGSFIDLNQKAQLRSYYGIEGYAVFELNCATSPKSNCDSAIGSDKRWELSLISQTYINNVPSFNRIVKIPISVAYYGNNPDQFQCNDVGSSLPSGLSANCVTAEDSSGSPSEVTLVGCGTTQDINKDKITALGFSAGHAGSGKDSTFIGYEAGKQFTGKYNTFIGHKSGRGGSGPPTFPLFYTTGIAFSIPAKDMNTFVGYEAGMNITTGKVNTFIGSQAGASVTTGKENVFIGSLAGGLVKTGSGNVYVGYNAGSMFGEANSKNTYIGYDAGGRGNTTENVFVGYGAGQQNKPHATVSWLGARHNTFIGYQAGQRNRNGSGNTFVGHSAGAGHSTSHGQLGEDNTFIGYTAGQNNGLGSYNTYIGSGTGCFNRDGSHNIIIGYRAACTHARDYVGQTSVSRYREINKKFIVGVNTRTTTSIHPDAGFKRNLSVLDTTKNPVVWIEGNIGTTTFKIKDKQVSYTSSSRTLKKNIKAFKDHDKALKDILKIPLFTFEFKDDPPNKSRMGIISEELPSHLQVKADPVLPDLPSIRGSLLAAIKALHTKFMDFKSRFESQFGRLKKEMRDLNKGLKKELLAQTKELNRSIETINTKLLSKIKKTEQNLTKKLDSLKADIQKELTSIIQATEKSLRQELTSVKAELKSAKTELSQHKSQLKETQTKLNKTNTDLKETETKLNRTNTDLKEAQQQLKRLEKTVSKLLHKKESKK